MGLWRTFGHFSLAGRSFESSRTSMYMHFHHNKCLVLSSLFSSLLTYLFFISLHKRMALETFGWCMQQQISPRSATTSAQPIIWQLLLVSVLHGVHSLERCKARQADEGSACRGRGVGQSWLSESPSRCCVWEREDSGSLTAGQLMQSVGFSGTRPQSQCCWRSGRVAFFFFFFLSNTVDAKIRADLQLSLNPPVRYRLPFSMIHTKLFMLSVF